MQQATSTRSAKMQGRLPKSSEAYCALEVGHPRELLLFICPAGVCHQINIIKCLPVWNKYLARKRSARACCLSYLTEGASWDALPKTWGKQYFLELEVSYPCYFVLLSHLSTFLILSASKFPKESILGAVSSSTKCSTKGILEAPCHKTIFPPKVC